VFCTDLQTNHREGRLLPGRGPHGLPDHLAIEQWIRPRKSLPRHEREAAARQAAIWHFSDGLNVATTDAIHARWQAHRERRAGELRDATAAPEMTLNPPSDTNFLPGGETHTLRVDVTQNGRPLPAR